MRKVIYSLICMLLVIVSACEDKLPEASWDLFEVKNLTASALDASVRLSWTTTERTAPDGYYVSWISSSTTATGGNLAIGNPEETSVTVDGLVNKVEYTFSIQAVYGDRRSGKISAKATPISSQVPPSNLTAIAGSERIKLTWSKPEANGLNGYKITVQPGGKVIEIGDAALESYVVTGLTNEQEYIVSLQAVYDKGDSEAVTATATPGKAAPIIGKTYVLANEELSLTYNDMYFMGDVTSVTWTINNGELQTGETFSHTFSEGGQYVIGVEVTNADGSKESEEMTIIVIKTVWEKEKGNGEIKVSNPVFSMDGNVFYLPTATSNGNLEAFDAESGNKLWDFPISAKTYGGGAVVGPNGTIYQGAQDGKLYAVTPLSSNASQKWIYDTGASKKQLNCFPAVTADGNTVYILDGDDVLHAINTSNGTKKWSMALEGTKNNQAGAIAIDKNGTVYAGTRGNVYAFDSEGNELWKTVANVTERGSFALDESTLYVALRAGEGVAAINTADGSAKWTVSASGDAYAPIVGSDHTVYFVDKDGKSLYAVDADGNLKWSFDGKAKLTYCYPALDDKGIVYFGTSAGRIYAVDTATGEEAWHLDTSASGTNKQIMAGVTIANEKLYVGYIGGNMVAIPIYAGSETATWSVRGGNIHGTNQY